MFSGGKDTSNTYKALVTKSNLRDSTRPSYASIKMQPFTENEETENKEDYRRLTTAQISQKSSLKIEDTDSIIQNNINDKQNNLEENIPKVETNYYEQQQYQKVEENVQKVEPNNYDQQQYQNVEEYVPKVEPNNYDQQQYQNEEEKVQKVEPNYYEQQQYQNVEENVPKVEPNYYEQQQYQNVEENVPKVETNYYEQQQNQNVEVEPNYYEQQQYQNAEENIPKVEPNNYDQQQNQNVEVEPNYYEQQQYQNAEENIPKVEPNYYEQQQYQNVEENVQKVEPNYYDQQLNQNVEENIPKVEPNYYEQQQYQNEEENVPKVEPNYYEKQQYQNEEENIPKVEPNYYEQQQNQNTEENIPKVEQSNYEQQQYEKVGENIPKVEQNNNEQQQYENAEENIPKFEPNNNEQQKNENLEENNPRLEQNNYEQQQYENAEENIPKIEQNINEQQQYQNAEENIPKFEQNNNEQQQNQNLEENKADIKNNQNTQKFNPVKKVLYAMKIFDKKKGANNEIKEKNNLNKEQKVNEQKKIKNQNISVVEKNLKIEEENQINSPISQSQNTKKKEKITSQESNKKKQENENESELAEKEIFLEGITYDNYLSKLASQNKKEHESGRESFCEGFFIASFPQKEGQVIENSQSFPSPCGHSECSLLPAMKPEIIVRYPLKDTKTLELNNLAATICFPTGIKVCYTEKSPSLITDYVTPITNQKGERYYMTTFHFYHKMLNEVYSKLYEMHPLKHHLMKFADSYLDMKDEEMDENITNKIQESLEKSQELGFRDYIYIPYCICLISKYPYVSEMKKSLKSIFSIAINNQVNNKLDLNNLIMYLIHSVPIPEKDTKVKFFIPYCNEGIELVCPKVQDISVMSTNISNLLKYFSIDRIVIIFRLMLFEKKILFIDNDYTRLSLVTDSFISLLYPFQWVHTYIPIMSDQMLKYLETFLPFINGINMSLMSLVTEVFANNENEDSEEVFLIYISNDKFRLGSSLIAKTKKKYKYLQENVPALPSNLEKELKNKLKKIKDELDSLTKNSKNKKIDLSEIDFRIRNVFIDMFVHMFHDYYKYMTFLDDDVVFNKNLFLEKITNNNDKHFYNEFIDTQLFQQFTQNIVKDELNYFTTMATHYEKNKKETIKRSFPSKFIKDKLYIIKPDYLKINGRNSKLIEEQINNKYQMNQEKVIEEYSSRIVSEIHKINDEYYNKHNCYIYTLPETLIPKETKPAQTPDSTAEVNSEHRIYKALKSLNLKSTKSFARKGIGMTEKEKDNIKETIKDFTIKIFKSEEIEDEPNLKKDLQNTLNSQFGREFFCNMLSKNVTNIILLKEKSFSLLGFLIYNSLLFILNIDETEKLKEQMVILVRSTKYFGKEKKGATITLWDTYKPKIQGYSKVNQANFWNKWYELEAKKETDLNNLKKEKIILGVCDIMINLELTKSFVKNVTHGLCEKEYGKESEQYQTTVGLITEKIIQAKYISKSH